MGLSAFLLWVEPHSVRRQFGTFFTFMPGPSLLHQLTEYFMLVACEFDASWHCDYLPFLLTLRILLAQPSQTKDGPYDNDGSEDWAFGERVRNALAFRIQDTFVIS